MQRARIFIVVAMAVAALAVVASAHGLKMVSEERQLAPVRDSVLSFIESGHPDAAPFLGSVSFLYQENGVFSGGGWYIEIDGDRSNYTVYADFSSALAQNFTGIPHRIIWMGNVLNGTIEEISYTHAV